MKNFTLWPLCAASILSIPFLKKTGFNSVKFVLVYIFTGISLLSQSQQPANKTNDQKLTPELEKNIRNTLKKSRLQLQLIENNGQMGLPGNVAAYFSSGNQTVFIEKDRLRIVVVESGKNEEAKQNGFVSDKSAISANNKNYRYNTFSIQFKGSSGFSSFEKLTPFETKRNFINAGSPEQNVSNVSSYGEIILKNIYPGIDLRLYSQENGQMEFDWILSPGADADRIKMKFEGQKKLSITKKGDLQALVGMGSFTIRLPESYYITPLGKQNISVQFYLSGKTEVGFKGYEKDQNKYPLVIDPDLLWGTYFDGANSNFDEYLYGIEFNYNNDLIYCAGAANLQVSTTYAAALSSAYDGTFNSVPDAFIYALTKNGQTIQYITYFGGSGLDVGVGISLSQSYVYVCGYTTSANLPITKSINGDIQAFDAVYHGIDEGFVAVFDLTLSTLIYSSYLGGPGNDKALTVRAVSDGSYYVSLASNDALPASGPDYLVDAADNTFGGNADGWIGKFTSMNALRFGTYIGGDSTDLINDFQVLSNGDVVFVGNTFGITELNTSVPDNPVGRDALFGRLSVPALGPVSFDIIEKIGGSGSDYAWGIYSLGDSVSIIVGQTNSADFPLGGAPAFQNVNNGGYDGFVARINNNGSGTYQASFVGGSNEDILVSIRPVIINNAPVLLGFGTTRSTDLATINYNGGSFYSNTNSGGYEMMWIICDLNVTSRYYLSYIGGSANDYLGQTGAPIGSNHLFYNSVDSALYLGTTTHSNQATHAPLFVGRGVADIFNVGVPVFDSTKGNGNNDTHVIIAISARRLFLVLPVKWARFETSVLADCSIQLLWETTKEIGLKQYIIERSIDGRMYESIATIPAGGKTFSYNDKDFSQGNERVCYRIIAEDIDGKTTYSSINSVQLCGQKNDRIKIYPTLVNNYFTISGIDPGQVKKLLVEVVDAGGKRIMIKQLAAVNGSQTIFFETRPARGTYFVVIKNAGTTEILHTQKITITI
jgi:hypothetical protein